MGTRADFYVGNEWLGSIAWDGYRIHEATEADAAKEGKYQADRVACWQIKSATDETAYRAAVAALLAINDDATTPVQGWPWPWEDSRTTDYAYVFGNGKTTAYTWGQLATNDDSEGPGREGGWPNMKDQQNVTLGKRSGVIVMGG